MISREHPPSDFAYAMPDEQQRDLAIVGYDLISSWQ